MAFFQLSDVKAGVAVAFANTNVTLLSSLLATAGFTLVACQRITLHNYGNDNIEVAYETAAGAAPVTGSMDVLLPGDSITFNWQSARVKKLYLKATSTNSKAYAWIEGK